MSAVQYYVDAPALHLQLRNYGPVLLLPYAVTEHIWQPFQQTWQPLWQSSLRF